MSYSHKKLLKFVVCPVLALSMSIVIAAEPVSKPATVQPDVAPDTPVSVKSVPAVAKPSAQAAATVTRPKAEVLPISIKGGGSQPISNLYVVWGKSYEARYKGVTMNYKISNVVKGIEDIEANKIDYAGSEIPLRIGELQKKGLFQFPTALISFALVANIPGVHSVS